MIDGSGAKYQLYGISAHGISWLSQYGRLDTFKTLRDDLNINCVRIAIYTAENGGYCTDGNKDNPKMFVKNGN